MYFSMNTKEPDEKACDMMIGKSDILKMNETENFFVKFGSEQARIKAKFPEFIYMTFMTTAKPVVLYLKYSLTISQE